MEHRVFRQKGYTQINRGETYPFLLNHGNKNIAVLRSLGLSLKLVTDHIREKFGGERSLGRIKYCINDLPCEKVTIVQNNLCEIDPDDIKEILEDVLDVYCSGWDLNKVYASKSY